MKFIHIADVHLGAAGIAAVFWLRIQHYAAAIGHDIFIGAIQVNRREIPVGIGNHWVCMWRGQFCILIGRLARAGADFVEVCQGAGGDLAVFEDHLL